MQAGGRSRPGASPRLAGTRRGRGRQPETADLDPEQRDRRARRGSDQAGADGAARASQRDQPVVTRSASEALRKEPTSCQRAGQQFRGQSTERRTRAERRLQLQRAPLLQPALDEVGQGAEGAEQQQGSADRSACADRRPDGSSATAGAGPPPIGDRLPEPLRAP